MAKKVTKKQTTKKATKAVKKAYKKSPKKFTILSLFAILVLFGLLFFVYHQGYLDDFLNELLNPPAENGNGDDPTPPRTDTGQRQDENGFYYYELTGYNNNDYYFRAKNLSGDALANQLQIILRDGFHKVSYGDVRYVLSYSDRNIKDGGTTVLGIYDNDVIATHWIGTGVGAWQREHVWPNSKLGIPRVNNNSKNQGSDLHNLRAITGINQTRSNRYFVEGSGAAVTVGSEAFYPGDDHKGDVARILFYMSIMYDELSLTNDVSKLINDPITNYTPNGAYSGLLDVLIKWHKEDPVDEFEMQRNDFIYSGVALDPNGKAITPQGNRNPFIDKPELVHLIWESKTIEDLLRPELAVNIEYKVIEIIYCIEIERKNDFEDFL